MIDIALVGAGRIGAIHGTNVRAHPKLRLKYVVDAVAASAEDLAHRPAVSFEDGLRRTVEWFTR